jgi:hypothetical protein
LSTALGTPIENIRREEFFPAKMEAAIQYSKKMCPNAQLRSATSIYNCMGMVFASRRTCVGIDDLEPVLRLILREDGYREVTNPADLKEGDVVVYKDNNSGETTHVGIVSRITPDLLNASYLIEVTSQWGAHGEYVHKADEVPHFLGQPAEFWTDRRICQ